MAETKESMNEAIKAIGEQMAAHMKKEQAGKVRSYRALNRVAKKGQILFTGSSLMEQFPVAELAASHDLGKTVYNRGIGGTTTEDFLREIDTVLFDLEPSVVFINIGTNDIREWDDGLSAVIMGIAAWAVWSLLHGLMGGVLTTVAGRELNVMLPLVAAVGTGVVVYCVLVIALRAITLEDMKLFPKGEKLAKKLHIH